MQCKNNGNSISYAFLLPAHPNATYVTVEKVSNYFGIFSLYTMYSVWVNLHPCTLKINGLNDMKKPRSASKQDWVQSEHRSAISVKSRKKILSTWRKRPSSFPIDIQICIFRAFFSGFCTFKEFAHHFLHYQRLADSRLLSIDNCSFVDFSHRILVNMPWYYSIWKSETSKVNIFSNFKLTYYSMTSFSYDFCKNFIF